MFFKLLNPKLLELTRDKAKEYFVIIQKIMGSYKANKYSDTLLKLAEYSINREI